MDNNASRSLYNLLVTHDFDPDIFDKAGKPIMDPEEAELFSFDYIGSSGKNYGTVVILIGDDDRLSVFSGDNIGKTMEPEDKRSWFGTNTEQGFLPQLKSFAVTNGLTGGFSVNNISKLKHTMKGMAAIKEGLFEGYYGRKKISYSDQPKQVRLMIKHNRDILEGEPRYRAIESLFVETADGERFRVPSRSLTHGRMIARHCAEGGTPYDAFGNYINEIMTEIATMSRFIRAAKHKPFTGEAAELVEAAVRHYSDLKAKAKQMISQRGYHRARESFNPAEIGASSAVAETIRNIFIEQTLDSRIEEALPILTRLKQNNMRELTEFESYINRLAEGTWAVPDTPEAQKKLNELMAQELPVGPDATNATEQLYDLLGDDELFDRLESLARDDPDADARPLIQSRLQELGYDIDVPDENEQDQNEPQAPDQDDSDAAGDSQLEDLDTDGVMMTRPSNMSSESLDPVSTLKRLIR